MQELYIVTSTGIKDKKPYSTLARVVTGKKDNGDEYTFIDDKSTIREAQGMEFGDIVEIKRTIVKS